MAKRITTSKVLTMVRNGESFLDVDSILEDVGGAPSVSQYLYELMMKHHMEPKDVITASGIERSYYYHILSGQKIPGRNILLRICLSLGATLNETNNALKYAGHAILYPKVRRDALLILAIEQKMGMAQTNQGLIKSGEVPLYREDSKYG